MRRVVVSAVVLVVLLPLACQGGPIWTEVGDAGNALNTAQRRSGDGPLTQIVGQFNAAGDTGGPFVDIYRFLVVSPISFSATTSGTGYDPALFLFDAGGFGQEANQDISATDKNAYLIGGDAPPTVVYLMIAINNRYPMNPAGSIFPNPMAPGQVYNPTLLGGASHSAIYWAVPSLGPIPVLLTIPSL